MSERIQIAELSVSKPLHDFIATVCSTTGFTSNRFWASLADALSSLTPRNRALLDRRDSMQRAIDAWHKNRAGQAHDAKAYRAFLEEIGYLLPECDDFSIETANVDPELASIAGPQLVVPATNARYALNAANARWGSLYDALYGTDMIPETSGLEKGAGYNPARGALVVARAAAFLDKAFPLARGSHADATAYVVENGTLTVKFAGEKSAALAEPGRFAGYSGEENLSAVLLANNNLHVEIRIDRDHPVGRNHPAGVSDVVLEAAITTILDMEDSIACVDGADKARAYATIFGLFTGDLTTTFMKDGKQVHRELLPDRTWITPDGGRRTLPGRSLLLIRNAAHHTLTDAVLHNGREIYEGILDCFVSALMGMADIKGSGKYPNSRNGSIYLVKPKMHDPDEMAFARDLFETAEQAVGLPRNTLKMGVMDEERRASANFKECIRQIRERLILINTGFLDRTGDEIHTSMEAGPMVLREAMRASRWIKTYEDANVDVGLACGLSGRAQIGKGMWAKPDRMAEMVEVKIAHPQSGANTAWVPSPTAATLHAMHYHFVDVAALQQKMKGGKRTTLDALLTIPVMEAGAATAEHIQRELDGSCQGILGYVARWVEQGIGASKIPDLDDVGLMEDRATLRISSQYIANWLLHGICTQEQVEKTLKRMAAIVDRQNAGDRAYHPMAPDFDNSIAFQAARDLIFKGREQPNGYTEHILTARRKEAKRKFGQE
ncbi:MAG: malate synthase G [Desulfovibrio sp.]|jgi:malate synthase|nr:malate synthase G [Desulfovibrio sp.]